MEKYYASVVSVISFDRDMKIRLQQPAAEAAFSRLFPNTQSTQTNVPDEMDAGIPRIIFSSGPKQLSISQIAAQLSLSFKRNDRNASDPLDIIRRNVRDQFMAFDTFKGKEAIRETAIIINMNFPSQQSALEMQEYLYNRFFKVERLAALASISFALGFRTEKQFFVNLEATVYELRTADVRPSAVPTQINIEDLPVTEQGYGVKLDVNTRPQRQAKEFARMAKFDELLSETESLCRGWVNQYMGFDS